MPLTGVARQVLKGHSAYCLGVNISEDEAAITFVVLAVALFQPGMVSNHSQGIKYSKHWVTKVSQAYILHF